MSEDKPMPLPSNLVLDQQTQQRRSVADYTLGRLFEAADGLLDCKVLVRPTQRHEFQSMLAFRGITVTNREIASIDLPDAGVAPPLHQYFKRYARVMDDATREVREAPVSEVLKRVAAGLSDGTAKEPPWRTTPGAELRAEVERLFDWIDNRTEITLVDKAAMGAYRLFTLDPFTNTADLLHVYITLVLIKSGVLQDQIVPTAVHIDRNRGTFHQLHQEVVRTGKFNDWVRFFADGFVEQCENQLQLVHELAQLPERYINRYMETVEPARRRDGFTRLASILSSFQTVTSQLIADRCGLSAKRARELLLKAEELEFVELVETRSKTKIYEVKDVRRAIDLYSGIVQKRDLDGTEK